MTEPRDCPCCGSQPTVGNLSALTLGVCCTSCGLELAVGLPSKWNRDGDPREWAERTAIERWNRRADTVPDRARSLARLIALEVARYPDECLQDDARLLVATLGPER